MRSLLLFLCCLTPLPLLAQETQPAGPPTRERVWEVNLRGKSIGAETATETTEGGKRRIQSKARVQLPGAPPFAFEQTTEVDAESGALVSYRLNSSMITSMASPSDGGATLKVAYMGNAGEKTFPFKGPAVVLDNLVWSQYSTLARLVKGRDEALSLTVLVPQRQAAVPGTFTPGKAFTAKLDGKDVQVRSGELTLAGQLLRLTYDVQGNAYRVEVPAAEMESVVRGFVPPAAGEAPEEVRWREIEVELESPLGKLPGTLCLPLAQTQGPYPGVVLVHGSGPNDRDETIGPNKPFRDLAHGLAQRGIASVRYDKRTFLLKEAFFAGGDEAKRAAKALEGMTLREETIDDAIFAAGWLKARPEVSRVFVAGHSLGAMAAPEIAAGCKELSGVVLLAGPARPIDVLTVEQIAYKARLAGKSDEEAQQTAEEAVGKLFRQIRAGELPDSQRVMGATVSYWKDLFARDDVPAALAKVTQPVLLLHGEADYQVRLVDYEGLKKALESREGVPHQAKLFPGLNHLFMKVEGKSTGAEYMREGKLATEVIDAVAVWIKATGD